MKFLILNYVIKDFSGSEINALQLCKALVARGHMADIGTFIIGEPLCSIVAETGIRVVNLLDQQNQEFNYDVVWAHHSPTLSNLLFKKSLSDCKILFSSLSHLVSLEAPPSFHEDIGLVLSHNEVNTETMLRNGVRSEKIFFFPNYAPQEFYRQIETTQDLCIRKIAIISNHIPAELEGLAKLAVTKGYFVDLIGLQNEPRFIDPDTLTEYDLVISIGKTVIYCFAMGKPVYCYDHFGGPGYITPSNFHLAQKNNFSGRGFDRQLSPEQMLEDIEANFSNALSNLKYLQDQCRQTHDLETNLSRVLEKIDALAVTRTSEFKANHSLDERLYDMIAYINVSEQTINQAYNSAQDELKRLRDEHESQLEKVEEDLARLESEVQFHKGEHELLLKELIALKLRDNQLSTQNAFNEELLQEAINTKFDLEASNKSLLDEIFSLRKSASWKLTRPLRWLRRIFN